MLRNHVITQTYFCSTIRHVQPKQHLHPPSASTVVSIFFLCIFVFFTLFPSRYACHLLHCTGTGRSLDGETSGEPVLVHEFTGTGAAAPAGRSVVIAPIDNFWVSGQTTQDPTAPGFLECGLRSTLSEDLPEGFSHSTAVVAGHGINNTLFNLGDLLLSQSGKARANPQDDFMLSHFGYWTDNGAYYVRF